MTKVKTGSDTLKILVKKLDPHAVIPEQTKRDILDACWDITALESKRVPGGGKATVRTGLAMAIPEGWNGHLRPRSGNAINTPLMVDAGTIDPAYRGEILVVLVNTSDYPYDVAAGIKIAQMKVEKIPLVEFVEVKELPPTERGEKGFGSTERA